MSLDIALLRKGMDWARAESRRRNRAHVSWRHFVDRGEHTWRQGSWANIKLGTQVEAKSVRAYGRSYWAVNPLSCGSSGCLAGHICVINGDNYLVPKDSEPGKTIDVNHVVDKDGKVHDISTRARELLGIDGGEAAQLFGGSHKIKSLTKAAQEIAKNYGEEL